MDWKEKALKMAEDCRKDIKQYISEGMKKNKAVELVLSESIIGAGFKAQIRYEFKY